MKKARLWALFAAGAAAMLPPVLAVVDFHGFAAPWLFGVWSLLIVGTLWAGRST